MNPGRHMPGVAGPRAPGGGYDGGIDRPVEVHEPMSVQWQGVEYPVASWNVHGLRLERPIPRVIAPGAGRLVDLTLLIGPRGTRIEMQVQAKAEAEVAEPALAYRFVDLDRAQSEVLHRLVDHAVNRQSVSLTRLLNETEHSRTAGVETAEQVRAARSRLQLVLAGLVLLAALSALWSRMTTVQARYAAVTAVASSVNNAILDNCQVRVSFATNDERNAKRVSDALGTATEMKAMRNYAGHRLSPWLGHLMVSRSETARPLLTPGEVMQLPATDEIVMAAGVHPIRAKKARYFEDRRFKERILPSPGPAKCGRSARKDAWSELKPQRPDAVLAAELDKAEDAANGGLRREPELPDHVAIAKETTGPAAVDEFSTMLEDQPEDAARQRQALRQQMRGVARQVALDPNDGIDL